MTTPSSNPGATGPWAPPTLTPPRPAPPPAPPSNHHRTRRAVVVAAVVAVGAMAVGGVVLLGRDERTAGTTGSSTGSSTTTSTSTTSTTVAPTTTLPTFTDADLTSAMPGAVDVPADWSVYSDPDQQHDPDADSGLCLGPNSSSLALSTGSISGVDGPTFDLPDGGWFGIEAYAFADTEAAAAFVQATIDQSDCTAPVTWTVDESSLDMLEDGFGDSAEWLLSETVVAGRPNEGRGGVRADVLMQDVATVTVDGSTYSYRFDEHLRYEQYGTVVVLYWLDGQYDFTGFESPPPWAYQPSAEALTAAVDAVRDGIMASFTA